MHRSAHPFGDERSTEDANLGEECGEFVATHARHHVPAANQQAEGVTDDTEQRVSGRVAVGVVDVLEAVDVQGEHGEWESRDGTQRTVELAPILQAGERVGGCERGEFGGGLDGSRLRREPVR